MRLFTGDECGLLKECIPEISRSNQAKEINGAKEASNLPPRYNSIAIRRDGVCRIDPNEVQSRRRGVADMVFLDETNSKQETSFAALRMNGSVEFWNGSVTSRKSFGRYDNIHTVSGDVFVASPSPYIRPLGLAAFPQAKRLCAGDTCGNISIISYFGDDVGGDGEGGGDVVERYNAYSSSKQKSNVISYTPGKYENNHLATAMAGDPINNRIAVGGRERAATVLDLATGKVVFKAKNLPPDPQTLLQHPIWP